MNTEPQKPLSSFSQLPLWLRSLTLVCAMLVALALIIDLILGTLTICDMNRPKGKVNLAPDSKMEEGKIAFQLSTMHGALIQKIELWKNQNPEIIWDLWDFHEIEKLNKTKQLLIPLEFQQGNSLSFSQPDPPTERKMESIHPGDILMFYIAFRYPGEHHDSELFYFKINKDNIPEAIPEPQQKMGPFLKIHDDRSPTSGTLSLKPTPSVLTTGTGDLEGNIR